MKKLVIVYHAYLYGDSYMKMLGEQFSSLIQSGLFQAADKMYIGLTDHNDKKPSNGVDWINRWWSFASSKESDKLNHKVEIVLYDENKELIDTVKWIAEYSKNNPDDYVLFFHSKGVTRQHRAVDDWRKYMEYFVIENWKDCIEKLDQGFDACGVMWNKDTVYGTYPHFSGMMFWTTAKYINTLDHDSLDKDWRYAAEFWIGTNPDGKIHEFHNSRMNDIEAFNEGRSHYIVAYPREKYAKETRVKTLQELNVEDGLYLTDKGCIHNYLPDYDNLFTSYRNKHINIFEVGYQYGGSCRLWEKYFPNAVIRAIDINDTDTRPHEQSAINLGVMTDITKGERTHFEIKDIKTLTPDYFITMPPDIAIDDGSHTLEDQLYFITLLYPNLKPGGLLIVEDVADYDNQKFEFNKLGIYYEVIDRREESGVFDDVLLIFKK